jgi:lipopolysaccharide export system permease protein
MRLPINRIQRYVLGRTMVGVAGALTVIASIIVLIEFVEMSRTVGVRAKEVTVLDVLGLTLLTSPSVILNLLPFVFLFGSLAAFVGLNRRSELVAIRAAGVSAWRFIFPAAAAAAAIGALTVAVLSPAASALADQAQRMQARMLEDYLGDESKAIWLRQGDGQTQIIIRAQRNAGPGVRLQDVSLFVYAQDPAGGLTFRQRIDAKEARLGRDAWTLEGARVAGAGSSAVAFDRLTVKSTLNAGTALSRFSSPKAVPFWALPGMIGDTERAGFSATGYRLQFQQLLATPLMFAAMSVLAAAFSLRLLRLGGLAPFAGAGVALGFAVFFLNQFCSALGKGDVLPPVLAAWTPPLLALLAGFTLLFYTEDG